MLSSIFEFLKGLNVFLWILFVVLVAIIVYIRTPRCKGKIGELLINYHLKHGLDKNVYRVLYDVMIPDHDGGTTQIDHIVLSPFKIFVIETKTIWGKIYGTKYATNWTQYIGKGKYQFQNPFRQNYKHIKCLVEQTGIPEDAFYHIIVFVGDVKLKNRKEAPENLVQGGGEVIKIIKKHSDSIFTADQLDEIEKSIRALSVANTLRNKNAHVKHVKQIIEEKNTQAKIATAHVESEQVEETDPVPVAESTTDVTPAEPEAEVLCPHCGSPMVKRQARKGDNAGEVFWGCSRYPKCRGIVKIDS